MGPRSLQCREKVENSLRRLERCLIGDWYDAQVTCDDGAMRQRPEVALGVEDDDSLKAGSLQRTPKQQRVQCLAPELEAEDLRRAREAPAELPAAYLAATQLGGREVLVSTASGEHRRRL